MNCTKCQAHPCRSFGPCQVPAPGSEALVAAYREPETQAVIQAAAHLVDGGRAGTLSRLEELEEFVVSRRYRRVGLAYCYGMEREATAVILRWQSLGIPFSAVACTAGGLAQSQVNVSSSRPGVSCNPLAQAAQLEADGVDLAVTLGLCLGHDILFTRAFRGDQTTLAVKDRVHQHRPLDALNPMNGEQANGRGGREPGI